MIRLRMLGLALVAVFALSAVAVASASAALPELVNKEGKEIKAGKRGFTSEGTGGPYVLETKSGNKIECSTLSNTGKVTGLKTDTVKVLFDGCKSVLLDEPCTSTVPKGKEEGDIETTELASELVYINKAKKEVGIVLKPKGTANFTTFECSGIKIEVKGSVIGVITPINKLVTPPAKFTLAFTQEKGVQKPTEYENEKGEKVKDVLETSVAGGAFEESGENATVTLLYEEAAEIKA